MRLARYEEQDAIAEFGEAYQAYARRVPGFIPRLTRIAGGTAREAGDGR